jgi:hypothetical protein
MPDVTLLLVGLSAFTGGVFCGTLVVGPKLYASVTRILGEMSHDMNPRRDAILAEGPSPEIQASYFASRASMR